MNEIHLHAPLLLRASPGSTALPSKFSGVAYSGAVIAGLGVCIDLSSTSVEGRLPLLHEHSRDKIIGVVESASSDGRTLSVTGRLFSDLAGSTAQQIAELASRGAPYQLSVGLYAYTEEHIPAGQQLTVNGSTVVGPVTILRRGMVRECSVVTLGADPNAKATMFGARKPAQLSARDIYRRRAEQCRAMKL